MRQIKFRVWNGKQMFPINASFEFEDGVLEPGGGNSVMQYTGAEDDNGVDIYEGDIVRLINEDGWHQAEHMQGVGVVQFYPGSLEFNVAKSSDFDNMPLVWGGTKSVEVIGNIHENPELLSNG